MNWISLSSKISFRSKCCEAITSSLCHRSVKSLFAESPQHLDCPPWMLPLSLSVLLLQERKCLYSPPFIRKKICALCSMNGRSLGAWHFRCDTI